MVNGNIDTNNLNAGANIAYSQLALSSALLALKPQSVAVNTNAASGNLYRATATATITLPGHSAGQVVGVINVSGTTTVAGTSIQGVGLSAAASFTLGTPGAAAILVDDGTNWNIVAGQQDTGWVALTLTTMTTVAGYYVPAVRVIGNMAYTRGLAQATGTITGGTTCMTFPSVAWPASKTELPFAAIGAGAGATLQTTGALAMAGNLSNGNNVMLDGLSYSLA